MPRIYNQRRGQAPVSFPIIGLSPYNLYIGRKIALTDATSIIQIVYARFGAAPVARGKYFGAKYLRKLPGPLESGVIVKR